MDGHGSHETTDFLWNCYRNNVQLLFLPPHTSHVLQPLDLGIFSPLKTAYRKRLSKISSWNDSTVVGKRNFLICLREARDEALTARNCRSGWAATGLWPVRMSKPLMSRLLLENTTKTIDDKVNDITPLLAVNVATPSWARDSSAVIWSTPRKPKELKDQLAIFNELEEATSTRRLLFQKLQKAWDIQAFDLAVSQRQIEALQAEVEARRPRKKRRVDTSPNSRFANIWDIQAAQILADLNEDERNRNAVSENPREALDGEIVDNSRGEIDG
jgi:hypothetical protein